MTIATGFTGRGREITVEVPDTAAFRPLDDDQRRHVMALIAAEHQGTESEMSALNRVYANTRAERLKLRGTDLEPLVEIRLRNLWTYKITLENE